MITVKKADLSHLDVLCEFQQAMALESEGMALDNATLRAGINALLTDRNKGQYYIAEQEGRVVGCLMITLEWSDWRNGWVWWIQSVFVAQDMRRKGVYTAMYEHIKKLCIEQGVKGIRLYADRNNTPAHKTYEKAGMSSEHYITFEQMLF